MDSSNTCPPSLDGRFGPAVDPCRRQFDLTLMFEEVILLITPSIIFILVASWRILVLCRRQQNWRRRKGRRLDVIQSVKLPLTLCYALSQLLLLVLWIERAALRTRTSVAAAALYFVNACVICGLSYLEHQKTIRPSDLLNDYLLFSILFDIARVRTLWLVDEGASITTTFTIAVVIKACLLVAEAWPKNSLLVAEDRNRLSPEDTSSIYEKSLLTWLIKLLILGYRKILLMDDLYVLPDDMSTNDLYKRAKEGWSTASKSSKHALAWSTFKTLKWEAMAPIPARLAKIGFTFAQPFLITTVIKLLDLPVTEETTDKGYGLIGAYGLIFVGLAVSNAWYRYTLSRFQAKVRSCLVSFVYDRTMKLDISDIGNSTALTLMSGDVERITRGLGMTHETWGSLAEACIALWLLERQLDLAALAPLGVALACGILVVATGAISGRRQQLWMKAVEERIGVVSTMLGAMKGVKMSGLSQAISELIQALRVKEIKSAAKFRNVLVWNATVSFVPRIIAPVVTFGIFVAIANDKGQSLDTARLFTSLSILTLLAAPLMTLFSLVPTLMAGLACFGRIQRYLVAEPRVDSRSTLVDNRRLEVKFEHNSTHKSQAYEQHEMLNFQSPSISVTRHDIVIENGSFGWESRDEPVLQDIDLSIERSTLTMLIGPVASGKSTLLKSILGESKALTGSTHVSSLQISFCDQTPWLRNTSIRDNIINFGVFDALKYNTIMHACAMIDDLDQFPNGDQSLVGSKGITLSGGQKQRIAIARALYADNPIAVLDDCFSGLDTTTLQQVFERVFGPKGIFRQRGTTVLVATHAVQLLPLADNIVALGSNGRIAEQGTFEYLTSNDGYVQSLLIDLAPRDGPTSTNGVSDIGNRLKTTNSPLVPEVTVAQKMSKQLGDSATYGYYVRAVGRVNGYIFIAILVVFTFLQTFPSVWLTWWSDESNNGHTYETGKYIGVYALMQVLCLIAVYAGARHVAITMVIRAGRRLHWLLTKTVMRAPMSFFNTTDTGITTNRFSQDMELIDAELPFALLAVGISFLGSIAQAALILKGAYYVGLAFAALIPVFYFVQKFYLRTSRQLRFMDIEAKSPLYSLFIETLSGLPTIRAFGWQKELSRENTRLLESSQRPWYLLFCVQIWLTLVLGLISAGLAVVVIGIAVSLRGISSPGFTGLALLNLTSFGQTLNGLVIAWTEVEIALGAVARVRNFEMEVQPEDLPCEKETPPPNWPCQGKVEFKNVRAAYVIGGRKVLDGLSLVLEAGQKIGICGRSGSGKSSMVLALFRMIEISGGTIEIDGLDLLSIPRDCIRTRLNGLPQEPYFLNGSIRLNIDPGREHSDEEILRALDVVELKHTIDAQGGIDVDMDCDSFSHGQRQMFCLARAILRRAKVVILDEATSSVDVDTDRMMQRVIRTAFKDSTLIVVAHRLNTILDFDRIAVLENGTLKEFGNPVYLLAAPSAFRDLYNTYNSTDS